VSRLWLLPVGDLMHLVISGEKLLEMSTKWEERAGGVGPPRLTLLQKAALPGHVVGRQRQRFAPVLCTL
jgi:hypothetical protein